VDLRFHGNRPSAEERAAIDALLGAPATGWQGGERDAARDGRHAEGGLVAAGRRDLLLPCLHALQDRVGWVSRGGLEYVCRRLSVPPAEAWGVATFYHLLATEPRPPVVAHVCDDLACRLAGAERLCARLEREVGPAGAPAGEGNATWLRSPCLGACDRAPAALLFAAGESPRSAVVAPVADEAALVDALARPAHFPPHELFTEHGSADLRRSVPQLGEPGLLLLARVGTVDPTSLEAYRASGGYRALARAVELGPERLIEEKIASKLVGRGGAAFPTGRKWQAVARSAVRPRYLVCNADESEPGTFKDRILLEHDPFGIVEAMTIAGYACGCERGFVYLRGEYPLALERLGEAIAQARAAGLLGDDVLGAGFRFDIEIRRGAGAYICGEETALFNSIEGYRGEPRSKPPFPVEVGLFAKPTVVNNVETLANVPFIVANGGARYAAKGTAGSTGHKLFCVSGRVERPGLYEVPFGTTLGELLLLAGGVAGGRDLAAVLLGGAAGSFVGPEALTLPLTFEDTRAAGTTLGSGVVLVYDDLADLPDALARIASFFRHESCGQCVPCRVGAVRQEEMLARLAAGRPEGSLAAELETYRELAQAMRDASICGLGQTASAAIESALARFPLFAAAAEGRERP